MISNCRSTAERKKRSPRYRLRSASAVNSMTRSAARRASQRYFRGSCRIELLTLGEDLGPEVGVVQSVHRHDVDGLAEYRLEPLHQLEEGAQRRTAGSSVELHQHVEVPGILCGLGTAGRAEE